MDSPRCLECIGQGQNGQTYRVNRANRYKCSTCKRVYEGSSFPKEAFEWRNKQSDWYVKTKKELEDKKNKVGLERLKNIQEVEAK